MNDITNLTKLYSIYNDDNFIEKFEEVLNKETSNDKRIEGIQKIIAVKKKRLQQLESQVMTVTALIGSALANDLLVSIKSNIDSLDMMNNDLVSMQQNITNDLVDSLQSHASICHEHMNELDKYMSSIGPKYQENLYYAVKNNYVTIDDLIDLRSIKNLTDNEIKMIDQVIEHLQKDNELAGQPAEKNAEQTAIEEKGKTSNNAARPVGDNPNQKGKVSNDTLASQLNAINYHDGMNYGEEVSEVRINYELANLEKQIAHLRQKTGKLSFKEAVTLQTLINQSENLNELLYTNQKQSGKEQRREGQMAKLDAKINSQQEAIQLERELNDAYQSQIFKLISARRERKLSQKMAKMHKKMVVIQSKQRVSTLVKFDKKNKKMMKIAQREATHQVVVQTAKDKIEQLRQFRDDVLVEARNVKADMSLSFEHHRDRISELQAKMGYLRGMSVLNIEPTMEETRVMSA